MKKKEQRGMRGWSCPLLIIWLVVVDQLTKLMVRIMTPQVDVGVFSLHLVTNTGASFSLFQGMNSLFIWISLMVIGFIVYYWDQVEAQNKLAMTLIVSGIIGNFIDRILLGHVIDFIDFKIWPVFNIADSCITIGVIWLLYREYKLYLKSNSKV
ncbi:MAG: signal peptidase II [Nanoarchaeota archaeon]